MEAINKFPYINYRWSIQSNPTKGLIVSICNLMRFHTSGHEPRRFALQWAHNRRKATAPAAGHGPSLFAEQSHRAFEDPLRLEKAARVCHFQADRCRPD